LSSEKQMVVTYKVDDQQDVKLSPGIVKRFLVSGNANLVTDQEVVNFIQLCRYQGLNPFLRDAYLIKYGSEPATMVVGKDFCLKRAQTFPQFKGMENGVIIVKAGAVEYRTGGLVLGNEELVGAWAKVYRKDWPKPVTVAVNFEEYVGRKKNGEVNKQWREKPATMIQKVALAQALRTAFPDRLRGLYEMEEMSVPEDVELPSEPVDDPKVVDIEPENITAQDIFPQEPPANSQSSSESSSSTEKPSDNAQQEKTQSMEQEVKLQLGRTAPEEIKGHVFRTAMIGNTLSIIAVNKNLKNISPDSFKQLPGAKIYKTKITAIKPEIVEQINFMSSLKQFQKAPMFWAVEPLSEVS